MTNFIRRSFAGAAPDTTLQSSIDGTATSMNITDGTGWPDGSLGPFVVILDPATALEEKILATTRTGNSITGMTRGWEGTAQSHTGGSCVARHGYSGKDADEANNAVSQTLGQVTGKGTALLGSAANTLAAVTPAVDGSADGESLVVDHTQASGWKVANPVAAPHTHPESDVTGLVAGLAGKMANPATAWAKGSMLAGTGAGTFDAVAAGAVGTVPTVQGDGSLAFAPGVTGAWGAYTPVLGSSAGGAYVVGNGTLTGRYLQIGKLVIVSVKWQAGTTSTNGTVVPGIVQVSLPVAPGANAIAVGSVITLTNLAGQIYFGPTQAIINPGDTAASLLEQITTSSTGAVGVQHVPTGSTMVSTTNPHGNWIMTLTYEAA